MLADIPTLFLAAIVTTSVLAMALIVSASSRGMEVLRNWGYALILHAITFVLLALRGSIPDVVSIVLANTSEALFVAIWITVIATFQKKIISKAVVVLPVIFTALVYAYYIDDLEMRLLVGNTILLFQFLTALFLLHWRGDSRKEIGKYLLSISLIGTVLLLLIRFVAMLFSSVHVTSLTTQNSIQTLVYLTSSVIPMVASLGFLVMTKERADRLVEEANQTLMAIFNSVEESILLTNREGKLLQINRVSAVRMHSTVQKMLGRNAFEDMSTDVANQRKALLEQVARTGKAGHMTDQREGRNYRLSMYPVEGDRSRFVITGADVTDELVAQASLRRSEAHFRAFFERSMFGMATTSPQRAWLTVNDALCQMLGYTRAELIKMSWDDITYSDDLGANLEAFNQVLAGRINEYSLDKRFIRKDGSLVFTHVASRCLRLEDGSVDYFVVLFKDISDEKAREIESALRLKELTDINLKLKNAQSQLLQSEKMAAVGQLAAGVAHEINNPVGFVSSNLHTLKNYTEQLFLMEQADAKAVQALEPLDPVRIEVERAHKEAQIEYLRQDIADLLAESSDGLSRVRKIVADLKNFSHVDDGEWQDVDLNQGLESTLHVAWNELKYKAKVVRDFGDIPFVHCIPGQINQVFLNLLINAVHAIQESGVITLRTRHDGDFVTVEVEDTGSGIPAEIKERIFEPFFTTKPVGKGTGLGLSISWEIVQRHKGTITVQSEVGHGTLFQVKLPALSTTQH